MVMRGLPRMLVVVLPMVSEARRSLERARTMRLRLRTLRQPARRRSAVGRSRSAHFRACSARHAGLNTHSMQTTASVTRVWQRRCRAQRPWMRAQDGARLTKKPVLRVPLPYPMLQGSRGRTGEVDGCDGRELRDHGVHARLGRPQRLRGRTQPAHSRTLARPRARLSCTPLKARARLVAAGVGRAALRAPWP